MKLALASLFVAVACGKVNNTPMVDAFVPKAQLDSLSPMVGTVQAAVSLFGHDFGDVAGEVDIGGVPATVVNWTADQIDLMVPDVKPSMADVVVHSSNGDAGPLPFRVILPPRIYIQNNATDPTSSFDSVTVMSFDPPTGASSQLGAVVPIGMGPPGYGGCNHSIAVHVATRRLYISGATGLAVFDIDPVMGTLAPIAGSPFITGGTAASGQGLAVNASGTRVWVAHYPSLIAEWDISAVGALTAVAGSPFMVTTLNQDSVVVSADGQHLYGNSENDTLGAYAVAAVGTITVLAGSPYATGANSFSHGIRPVNDQVFLPTANGLAVWQPGANGVPVQITGSPFVATKPATGSLAGPAFTPDGNRVYIGVFGTTNITGFSLASNGTPTALPGSPWSFPTVLASPSCGVVSTDGSYLIETDANHKRIGVFTLAADGTPTATAGSPVPIMATESMSGVAITF